MTDKIVIITGASRGIGAATAIGAAKRGYAVCINYLQDHAFAQKIVEQIKQQDGKAIAVAADVSQEIDVERLFETVDSELGTLTALVNNVGILESKMRLDQMTTKRLMQRGGYPDEVANVILWLLSKEASYVTGAFIDAAGGR